VRILQLMGAAHVGGAETFAAALTNGLQSRGHDCLLGNTWEGSALDAYAAAHDVPYAPIPGGRRFIGLRWLQAMKQFLRENQFDLIMSYGMRISVGLRLLLGSGNRPVHVMAVRGLDVHRRALEKWIDRATERRVDMIVCNSKAVARQRERALGTNPDRMRVIPNGIDVKRFTGSQCITSRAELGLPEGFLFINVANFRPEKDHETLLRAFRIACNGRPDAKLVLVGGGNRAPVEETADRVGVCDRVVFTGAVGDVVPYLQTSDVFVLSSHSEGMPRSVMEAMALGKPVVSTKAGGVAEIAEDGTHALLVPVRDPDTLGNAMARAMQDTALRDRLGRAAARHIRERFDIESIIDQYVNLYEELLPKTE